MSVSALESRVRDHGRSCVEQADTNSLHQPPLPVLCRRDHSRLLRWDLFVRRHLEGYQAQCLHLQDSDYENPDEHSDSEMYVMPAEETGDDSYEPPPAEQQTRVVHPALPFTRGEYVGEVTVDSGATGWGDGQTQQLFEGPLPVSTLTSKQLYRSGEGSCMGGGGVDTNGLAFSFYGEHFPQVGSIEQIL